MLYAGKEETIIYNFYYLYPYIHPFKHSTMHLPVKCKLNTLFDFDNFYPFTQIHTFRRLCSRQPFENMATKEEIAQCEQFLLLSPCFQL